MKSIETISGLNPLVSVITPSFNHGRFIKTTIESVVKQTYRNIEYFVIDDGSGDDSPLIIKELSEKYTFYFEVQQNKGLAYTYNKLLSLCKGKYVAFIESDDVWVLDKVEKQVAFMEQNTNVGACLGNVLLIDEDNNLLPAKLQNFNNHRVLEFANIIVWETTYYPISSMIRKEALDKVGAYEESLAAIDWYTWLKISQNNYPIVLLPDLFGLYRLHKSNIHYDVYKMYKTNIKILDFFKEHPFYNKAIKKMNFCYFPYLAFKHKREAFFMLLNSSFKFKWRTIEGMLILITPAFILNFFIYKLFKNILFYKF